MVIKACKETSILGNPGVLCSDVSACTPGYLSSFFVVSSLCQDLLKDEVM